MIYPSCSQNRDMAEVSVLCERCEKERMRFDVPDVDSGTAGTQGICADCWPDYVREQQQQKD